MSESLKKKTVLGLAWSGLNRLSMQILHFILGIVLARLLCPEDFGMLAMIAVFTNVLTIFTDGGLTTALIRKEDRTEIDISTVFWYNLIACWLIYIIMFLASPFIADFYGMPQMSSIIKVVTLSLLVSPLSNIQSMHFNILLDFKRPAIITLITTVVSGLVALVMAYIGYGVWALVAQSVVGSIIVAILSCYMIRWRPMIIFSKKSFKELFGFSSKLLMSQCLNKVYENITPLVVGKFYSAGQLGYYEKARGWAILPSKTFNDIVQSVTFPVLSKMQGDIVRLTVNYRKMLRLTAFIVFPMMVGLAVVAKPLTLFVVTEKWADSIILLQLVCFSMMWYPIHSINLNLLTVMGRSDLFLRLEIIKKILGLSIMICTLPFGLVYFVAAGIVSSMISLVINTYYTGKLINVGYWKQMGDLMPIFINCCVMGSLSLLVQIPFEHNGIKLTVAILTGLVYYLLSAYIIKPDEYVELIRIIKNRGK